MSTSDEYIYEADVDLIVARTPLPKRITIIARDKLEAKAKKYLGAKVHMPQRVAKL